MHQIAMTLNGAVSPELYGKAFHASPVAFVVCRPSDGRLLEVNESFLRLLGFSREEVIDRTDLELGLWTDPAARHQCLKGLAEKRAIRDIECRLRTRTGEVRNTLASVELIEVQGQAYLLLMAYDMTERLHWEVQLRQAHKMEAVGQLAAGFAHDFNNILAIVQGYTSLLLSERELDGQANLALKEVSTAAERAANLTRQLLTFSRKQFMHAKTLNLNEAIQGSANMLAHLLGEKIELKFQFSLPSILVKADTGMMEQVIVNLAANARDAMPQGGVFMIHIAAVETDERYVRLRPNARVGSFVCVTVSDTGCGMSPATLNRIFEPFFTTKKVGQGTGLGLATVYGIVKQHNGWIEVNSQPGQGTTFKIFLPAEGKVVEPSSEKPVPAAIVNGGERILVVEDETALRLMVEGILQRHGYRVLAAANGVQALQVWEQEHAKFDLLLTDMVMPEGMTGRQLAEQLKAQKPTLKVVYTSGYSVDLISEASEELTEGLNFLQKPYRPQNLTETVRNCLAADGGSQNGEVTEVLAPLAN